ncbi:MAG: MoaD/ThiS family protein [Chloroflexi bacterium]|nr:MoaD/ThiS family protein [Chloroflexota bacterium]
MAEVWLFASLKSYAGGKTRMTVAGATVRELVDNLERQFPGIKEVLSYQGDLMPGLAVVVDGLTTNLGMLESVQDDSEVHFLPAIGGG